MSSREAEAPNRKPQSADQRKVVVIGFGSPIRGDDALGPLVADLLADQLSDPRVEVHSRHILTAELAELLCDTSLVVFIDASVEGEIGEVVQRTLEPRRDIREAIAHSVDAPGLLAWTEGLYGKTPPAILFATRGVTFDYANYQLSPAVESTVSKIINQVRELVDAHLDDASAG